jgi:hypothetical protein
LYKAGKTDDATTEVIELTSGTDKSMEATLKKLFPSDEK